MVSSLDLSAGQLALLAARASVTHEVRIRDAFLRIAASRERFTPAQLIHRLAVAPKPLLCTARVAGGNIELSYKLLVPETEEFEWHARHVAMMAQRGGWERLLAGPERLVYCVGRAETLLLPAVAVDHWDRDYSMESVNMVGDTTSNPRCVERPEYIEAKRQGAAGIIIFTSPADNHGKVYMFKKGDG